MNFKWALAFAGAAVAAAAGVVLVLTLTGGGGNEEPAPRAASQPTESPEKEAQVRQILFQNDAVEGILAGRQEGRDYWLKMSYGIGYYADAKGTDETPHVMVNIYFDPPVSWSGQVPTRTSPCQTHYQDDWLDPSDPCRNELPQFAAAHKDFSQAQGIVAEVDLRRGQVVQVFQVPVVPDELRDAQKRYAP